MPKHSRSIRYFQLPSRCPHELFTTLRTFRAAEKCAVAREARKARRQTSAQRANLRSTTFRLGVRTSSWISWAGIVPTRTCYIEYGYNSFQRFNIIKTKYQRKRGSRLQQDCRPCRFVLVTVCGRRILRGRIMLNLPLGYAQSSP